LLVGCVDYAVAGEIALEVVVLLRLRPQAAVGSVDPAVVVEVAGEREGEFCLSLSREAEGNERFVDAEVPGAGRPDERGFSVDAGGERGARRQSVDALEVVTGTAGSGASKFRQR
jgi:hypothetical protein